MAAAPSPVPHRFRCAIAGMFLIAFSLVQSGCATLAPETPARPRDTGATPAARPSNAEPPPPNVNLSGFPLPYRQGYADGCASAGGSERKDATRFAADGNYRTGWQDGRAICGRR